jgi:chromosome segregation ATPase
MIEEKHINVTLNFDASPEILQLISQGMRVSAMDEVTPLKKRINELEDALQTKNLIRENDYSMSIGSKNEKITQLEMELEQLKQEKADLGQTISCLERDIKAYKEINDSL